MASSQEILAGIIGMMVFTFVDLVLYVISNAILGPLMAIVNQQHITPLLGMAENTYTIYLIWGFLFMFEIGCVLAFIYIVGRRQISQVYI